ncbi:MAG: PQQ-binding-like beta-propeller repeat protein [Myxococcota bacterium]
MKAHAIMVMAVLCPAATLADTNITVDGNDPDWAAVTSCINEPTGDGRTGIDLIRVCVENNNTAGSNGYLFSLYELKSARPTNTDTYFGVFIDKNDDGQVSSADEVWAFHYRSNNRTPLLEVYDPVSFALRRTYTSTADCGGAGTDNGWSTAATTKIVEGRVSYGCLGLTYGDDTRLIQLGVFPNFDVTSQVYYDGTSGTVTAAAPPADVSNLVAISKANANVLVWNNPTQHEGVLVLRAASAAPNAAPVKGTTYTVGQTLGNATVAYSDADGSTASSFTDSGLTNGTRYYYKVYNHHQHHTYASGNVPSSSGIFSEPTSRSGSSPQWCYSFGFPSLQRPTTESNAAVFTSSQLGAVTASRTDTGNATNDGLERFRPVQLSGAVQARFPLLDLVGHTGKHIVTGDQSGRVYAISAQTGALTWTANGGAALGNAIQHFVMPHSTSGTAPWDRLLVGTRNSSTTNNQVFALSSSDGAVLWTYSPGNLDIISGGMVLHAGRVYVPARSGGGTSPSLRVLDALSGTEVTTLSGLGDLDYDLNKDLGGLLYATSTAGMVHGVDMATHTVRWSFNAGATSAPVFVTGNGFVASLKSGTVRRYMVSGTTVTELWSTPIANPTGVVTYFPPSGSAKYFVGSSDGRVYKLNTGTGAIEAQLAVSSLGVGMPTIDSAAARLHVGTFDGRLCSFTLP